MLLIKAITDVEIIKGSERLFIPAGTTAGLPWNSLDGCQITGEYEILREDEL